MCHLYERHHLQKFLAEPPLAFTYFVFYSALMDFYMNSTPTRKAPQKNEMMINLRRN
jgi:hypothetical protein